MKGNLIFILVMLSLTLVSANNVQQDTININLNERITITQVCANSTYSNITTAFIDGSNNQLISTSTPMTEITTDTYSYQFNNTNVSGVYYFYGTCDESNDIKTWGVSYLVKSNSLTYLIILLSLAVVFFLATLVVNEEFFVYISGVLFLVSGIYVMINGIDVVNDWYSRSISYVLMGIGLLFTVGAYIYNSYENDESDEEYD